MLTKRPYTINPFRAFFVTVLFVGIFPWLALPALAETQNEERRHPEEFPSVPRIENSMPRYGAVHLDPWDEEILYFMFDGNREVGYNRMYVWVPDGRDYATPQALNVDADHNFRTVSWQSQKDDEVFTAEYTFRSRRTSGTHGTRTHVDYLTGETEVRAARPFTNLYFQYTVDVTRDRSPRGHENLMQLRIPSPPRGRKIGLSTNLSGVTPEAVWENVNFYWEVERIHSDDPDKARLHFTGRAQQGQHSQNRAITLMRLPTGFFDLHVRVAPYMKEPVFEEVIPAREMVNEGLVLDVPFGWYRASYAAETHPWIGGRELSRSTDLRPLGRRSPASSRLRHTDEMSPASRLRGPSPSQLRGGPGSR